MSEAALLAVGRWGRLHWRLALLLAVPVLLTGMSGTNYVFLAADTDYRCHIPECEEWPPAGPGAPAWGSWALVDRCARRVSLDGRCTNASFSERSEPCARLVYLRPDSLVAQFQLGCREGRRALLGTAHNLGMFVSLPVMGYVSDRWGRRAALVLAALGAGAAGGLKSWAPDYWSYAAAELLEAAWGAGIYPAAFVLMIEWLSASQRALASLALGVPLAAGGALLALLVPATGSWRRAARLAYLPAALVLPYRWLLPDSARWLAASGRAEEAARTVRRAAAWNRAPPPGPAAKLLGAAEPPGEGLWRAVRSSASVRRRLAVCGCWWASCVFVLYGLAVLAGAGRLSHAAPALLAAAELPALLLNTLLLERLGRRLLLRASCLLTAAACLLLPAVSAAGPWGAVSLLVVAKLGASMSINVLYVYSAELFPTSCRVRLLTLCSALGRLASILAPLAPLLAAHGPWLPSVVFGTLPLGCAALTALVPDTLRAALPATLADLG